MKRKISLLLVFVLIASLAVGCGGNQNAEEKKPEETPVAESTEQNTEEKETEPETKEPETQAVAGEIATIGLGSVTSTSSSKDADGDKLAKAQADVTIAVVAFDADGKIVDAKIDVAQNAINFNKDNTDGELDPNATYPTKMQKGDDYGMRKASEIKAEWDEQAVGFAEFIKGKTAEEVMNIPTKAADDHHQHVPDDEDLRTTTTMDIDDMMRAVAKAGENQKDAKGATKIALGVYVSPKTTAKDGDKNAKIQINTTFAAVAYDDDNKIVQNITDAVQPKIEVDAEGKIVERMEDVATKKELKDDYNMRKASAIGKEWFEQMESWEEYTIGKTVEEVANIKVKEANPEHQHVPDVEELTSSVTMTVEAYQQVLQNSLDSLN